MKSKLALVLILLMSFLLMIPPMFAKGGLFNVQYQGIDNNCNTVIMDGLYFDNVFYIIMYTSFAFLGFVLPFLVEKLNKNLKRISFLIGSWFFSGFVSGILNLSMPELVYNSSQSQVMFIKFAVFFSVGLVVIMSSEIWSKQKNS